MAGELKSDMTFEGCRGKGVVILLIWLGGRSVNTLWR